MLFSTLTLLFSLSNSERVGSFIVLGDWGYASWEHCPSNSPCGMSPELQQKIANRMKQWVADNDDVKFVLNLGDSFYPTGVSRPSDDRWNRSWKDVYGETITNLRWYSVYGNHDYEGADRCACGDPANDPSLCAQRFTSGSNVPSGQPAPHIEGMGGWYMPELYYYDDTSYLEELGIEIVALDTNSVAESACRYLPRGCSRGACWANLNARYRVSMDLAARRLKETRADNLLIFNHYPTYYFHGSRYSFIDALRGGANNDASVYFFGGHTHYLKENYGYDVSPAKSWLVGGGGGWGCDGATQGFVVGIVNKDENGRTSISTQQVLVGGGCYHHHLEGEAKSSEVLRADVVPDFNTTCGGLECQDRQEKLMEVRATERLAGASTENTAAKQELVDEAERASGADFEFSQYFKDTIEEIRQAKAARRAAKSSSHVQVE